jgi:hypothetical protein
MKYAHWIACLAVCGTSLLPAPPGAAAPRSQPGLPVEQLTAQALRDLAEADPGDEPRRAEVAEQAWQAVLHSFGAAVRSGERAQVLQLAAAVAPSLPAERRKQLLDELIASVVEDGAVQELTFEEFQSAQRILMELRASRAAEGLAARWIEASDAWQRPHAPELGALAALLGASRNEEVATARTRVSEWLWPRVLASGEHPDMQVLEDHLAVTAALGSHWSDQQKQQLLDLLKSRCMNAAWLSEASYERLTDLRRALRAVGSPADEGDAAASWVESSARWRDLEAAQIERLIRTVRGEARHAGLRRKLADRLSAQLVDRMEGYGALEAAQQRALLGLIASGAADMATAQRATLADALEARVLAGPPAIEQMSHRHFDAVRLALRAVRSQRLAEATAAWVESGDKWINLEPMQIVRLLEAIGRRDAARHAGARDQLAAHLTAQVERRLDDFGALAARERSVLLRLVATAASQATPAQRRQLLEAVERQVLSEASVLAPMSHGQMHDLQRALGRLGAAAGDQSIAAARWVSAAESRWFDQDLPVLAEVIRALGADQSPAVSAAQGRVFARAWERYLGNEEYLSGPVAATVHEAVAGLDLSLTARQKQQVLAMLESRYLAARYLRDAPFAEVLSLQRALGAVDGEAQAADAAALWVRSGAGWTELGASEALRLMESLRDRMEHAEVHRMLAGQALQHLLLMAMEVEADWVPLVKHAERLRVHLDREQRQLLQQGLRWRFLEHGEDVSSVSPRVIDQIGMVLRRTGGEDQAEVTAIWIEQNRQVWQSQPTSQLLRLVRAMRFGSSDRVLAARTEVSAFAMARHLARRAADPQGSRIAELTHLSGLGPYVPEDQQRQLLEDLLLAAQTDAPMLRSSGLMSFIGAARALGAREDQVIRLALAWCLADERPPASVPRDYWHFFGLEHVHYFDLAWFSEDRPQLLAALRVAVHDEDGNIHLAVARGGAWAARTAGEIPQWQQLLDGKLSEPGLAGDRRARWLLARGYLEELRHDPPAPLAGKGWLDQSLAAAESEQALLECVQWLAVRYVAASRFSEAETMLLSMERRFDGDELRLQLRQMREGLPAAAATAQAAAKRHRAGEETRRLQGQLETLRQRLSEAQQRGAPAEDIAALESVVRQTEHQIRVRR